MATKPKYVISPQMAQAIYYLAVALQTRAVLDDPAQTSVGWAMDNYHYAAQGGHPTFPPEGPFATLSLGDDVTPMTLNQPTYCKYLIQSNRKVLHTFWRLHLPKARDLYASGDILFQFLMTHYHYELGRLAVIVRREQSGGKSDAV